LRCDHPDIESFVHAKDQGSFRNFNLSVAVTDAFMQALVADREWELAHRAPPVPELVEAGAHQRGDGLWVYRTVRAVELWRQIMASTYDHAEPGVVFIDQVNRDNNLSYCEVIEATNPCVTADTWVMSADGPRQVSDLVGTPFTAIVDGKAYPSGAAGFFPTGIKPVVRLTTAEGHVLRLTEDHKVQRVVGITRCAIEKEWVAARDLRPNDRVMLHDHRAFAGWAGRYGAAEGYLTGLLLGDGYLHKDYGAVLYVWDEDQIAV